VRVKKELRTPENMAKIQRKLEGHPGVKGVTVNQRTGSVVFTHEKDKDGHSVLAAVVQETELLVDVAFDIPPTDEEGGGDPYAKLDQQLADLMYKVEYAVWKKTGLRFRGQVVAGSVAGLGAAQIAMTGITLETLPGPILLWIAWDIYHRVAKEPPFPAEADATAENAPAEMQAGDPLPA
jgi:cation transport ATPase